MPPQGLDPITRFLTAFKEDFLDPLAQISGDVTMAVGGEGAPAQQARARLASLPAAMARGFQERAELGGEKIGTAIVPGNASTELGPRTNEVVAQLRQRDPSTLSDQELQLVLQSRQRQPSMSTSERVQTGASGVMDLGSLAAMGAGGAIGAGGPLRAAARGAMGASLGPVTRLPAERAEQGDVAGALGSLTGIAAPEIPRGVRSTSRALRGQPTQGGQPIRRPSSVELETGEGAKSNVRVTRGEGGSAPFRVLEPIARGGPIAGAPLRRLDQQRVATLQKFGDQVVQEVRGGSQQRTLSGAGARLSRNVQGRQQSILDASKKQLGAAEQRAAVEVPEITPTNLSEFAMKEADVRGRLGQRFNLQGGERAMVTELRSLAGEDSALAKGLAELPEEVRVRVEDALNAQMSGRGPTPIPTDEAFKLMKILGERAPEPGTLAPGVRGGTLKGLAGALRADIDAALSGTEAFNMLQRARNRFRISLNRLEDPTFKSVIESQSQAGPGNLLNIDVRQIPRMRAAAGQEAFRDAAANMLEQRLSTAFTEGTLSTESTLPKFFRAEIQAKPSTAESALKPLNEAGRGAAIVGQSQMRALNDWARVLDRVAQSSTDAATVVGRVIELSALAGLADLGIGALTGGSPVLGGFGQAGSIGAGVALRLASEMAVRPGGAQILKGLTENINSPGKQLTFWSQRAGDFIRNDPELKNTFEQELQPAVSGQR